MKVSAQTYPPDDVATMELATSRARTGATRGYPVESYQMLFEDELTFVGVWQCTPGRFPVTRVESHSYMLILSGRGRLIESDGSIHELVPGTVAIEANRWSGDWEIDETIRKFFVITKVSA